MGGRGNPLNRFTWLGKCSNIASPLAVPHVDFGILDHFDRRPDTPLGQTYEDRPGRRPRLNSK